MTIVAMKHVAITYSWRVSVRVASVIQDTQRMCRVILSFVVCLSVPYFSTLSHEE